jgi:hypothetical protein
MAIEKELLDLGEIACLLRREHAMAPKRQPSLFAVGTIEQPVGLDAAGRDPQMENPLGHLPNKHRLVAGLLRVDELMVNLVICTSG